MIDQQAKTAGYRDGAHGGKDQGRKSRRMDPCKYGFENLDNRLLDRENSQRVLPEPAQPVFWDAPEET